MAQITGEQISATYDVGRDWLRGSISRSDAVRNLSSKYGLNAVSAGDLLQVLKAMFAGERFTRSISAPAADIYLGKMATEFDAQTMGNAIEAIDKHIEYYEGIRPVTLHKLRKTREKWATAIAEFSGRNPSSNFDAEVAKMLAAPASERLKNLPLPGTKPKASFATVKVFQRNAAVAAEVLLRAQGKCETCKQPAPFLRAWDGRPFLEVHHVVRLADDGEDTVENAIAVCPNCHRFHHFG